MKERDQVRLFLSQSARREIDLAASQIGMKQIDLLSRLCEWFSRQDKSVKLQTLGILTAGETIQSIPDGYDKERIDELRKAKQARNAKRSSEAINGK